MANSMTVPIEGAHVKQGTSFVKTEGGGVAPAPGQSVSAEPVTAQSTDPATAQAPAPIPSEPTKPLSLLEQFHPSLNPEKVQLNWDEAKGRLVIAPKPEAQTEETPAEEFPALAEQHSDIRSAIQAETPTAASEVQGLRDQLAQMSQLVTAMAQAQLAGKPLGEILGVPQSAAQPVEPDYSEVDFYDPAQLASFIKQTVNGAIQGAMAPHQQTIENSRRRQEYDRVASVYGSEPNFNNKVVAAIQLVSENQSLTIEQAYGMVSRVQNTLSAQSNVVEQPKQTTTSVVVQPAQRTISPEQAQAKAEQAKRLPATSGVVGASAPVPPAHIKGLGQLLAWNLQQASLGN